MAAVRGSRRIRPPRRGLINNNPNDVDFESTWAVVSASLREMHTKNASQLSFETIYRHAYKIVLKKKGDVFYERVREFESNWLTNEVWTSLQLLTSPSLVSPTTAGGTVASERRAAGERFLKGLKQSWEDHHLVMNMATDVFMYLDRVYCQTNKQPSLYAMAMGLFRDTILRTPLPSENGEAEIDKDITMSNLLTGIILEQIAMERDGDIIDKNLIRSCVYMLEGLYETPMEDERERLYLTSFEERFLDASRDFYRSEGAKLLESSDAGTYCRHTRARILEEQDRCRSTLSQVTASKITAVVEDELIRNKIKNLILMDSGARHMVDNDRFEDLELIYDLNSRIDPKKAELTKAIQKRVTEVGNLINEAATQTSQAQPTQMAEAELGKAKADAKVPAERNVNQQTDAAIKWVDDILQLKDKYDQIWRRSFQADAVIQPALTRSLTETINTFPRSSEFISLFIDENMKKGIKDKTEAEIDQVLEKAIVLLRYIQDKDMFERYYKKHLCKRLLMGKSLSTDVEKQMISRMKIELGNSFTGKLEAMFKDMALSEELSAGYRNRVAQTSEAKRTDLSINVLTSMTWPLETMNTTSATDSEAKCIFPPTIDRIKKGFENFYAEQHSGRKLSWKPNMGTADIRAVFPKVEGKEAFLHKERRHELNVSTYAMIILLLFNDLPKDQYLTFDDIQGKTNIPVNELSRNLQSLAVAPKTRILVKEPMSKEIKNTDKFYFNDSFYSKFVKLKVGVVSAGNRVEGDKERRETERQNNDSRSYAIEAAVVRIMKQRKELSHQQLIAETLSQLTQQFKPDVHMIKKRIESLIEREYLERADDSATAAYKYLA